MSISQMLLPEFDQEMSNTRKLLELVPEDKFNYKPHEKSMSMGQLASHIADMAGWAQPTIETDVLELKSDFKPYAASSRTDLLQTFDKNIASARAAIVQVDDEHLKKTWKLKFNGETVLSLPRSMAVRSMILNHIIHHRAQLSVYLRLNNVEIPGMYGPSADETAGTPEVQHA
jgi:uncharacterized damage-inducible protein DinB